MFPLPYKSFLTYIMHVTFKLHANIRGFLYKLVITFVSKNHLFSFFFFIDNILICTNFKFTNEIYT